MDKVFDNFGGYDGYAALCGDTCPLSEQDRRLLGFLHDDIIKMMNNRG